MILRISKLVLFWKSESELKYFQNYFILLSAANQNIQNIFRIQNSEYIQNIQNIQNSKYIQNIQNIQNIDNILKTI